MNQFIKSRNTTLWLVAFALIIFGSRLNIIDLLAVGTPYWDDWGMASFLNRYFTDGLSFNEFFVASNEHRLSFNRLLSVIIFDLNQEQWDPMISMTLNAIIWTISGIILLKIFSNANEIGKSVVGITLVICFWVFPISLVNLLWGIQTHNYTMILFAILGCWLITNQPLTKYWWFGIFSMAAACVTMAGGSFVSLSVFGVYLLATIFCKQERANYMKTVIASGFVSILGMYSIFAQSSTKVGSNHVNWETATQTFLKTIAWPSTTYMWTALVYFLPIIMLGVLALRENKFMLLRKTRFALCLYGFVFLNALAIAYARDAGGLGPTRRYFEFLALLPIASVLALHLLINLKQALSKKWLVGLTVVWVASILISLPNQIEVLDYTLKDRAKVKPIQEEIVRNYLNTQDVTLLQNKPMRHVPFHHMQQFGYWLPIYNMNNILPYQIQQPKPLKASKGDNVFVENGTFFPYRKMYQTGLFGEKVRGSYGFGNGGESVTGGYESQVLRLDRSYAMIPVTGYTGYQGMSLKLVNQKTGKEYPIIPKEINSKYAERWRNVFVKVKKGKYRLVAEDNNKSLWFGFAAPRAVGKISYWNKRLIENGQFIWNIGALLILLLSSSTIFRWFEKRS